MNFSKKEMKMTSINDNDYFTGLSLRKTTEIKLTTKQQERLIDLVHGYAEAMRSHVPRHQMSACVIWADVFREQGMETVETFTYEALSLVQEINDQQVS